MARGGILAAMARAAREAERRQRQAQREAERAVRLQQQRARAAERARKTAEKEAAIAYRESREDEVESMNEELATRVELLENILTARATTTAFGTRANPNSPETRARRIFERQRKTFALEKFEPEAVVGPRPVPPNPAAFRTVIAPLSFWRRLLGGAAKHTAKVREAAERDAAALSSAHEKFKADLLAWQSRHDSAQSTFAEKEQRRESAVAEHNKNIDLWEQGIAAKDPDAVVQLVSLVLDSSDYPEELPEEYRAAYTPESAALVIEYVLPTLDVIPTAKEYSYIRAKDEIREKPRSRTEITGLYRNVIAALTLRTLGELFDAVPVSVLQTVTFNGILHTVDPATGMDVRPCLISVRSTREEFGKLNLERVDPVSCLAALGATVSKRPEDRTPVRPVIEFDMADRRFVVDSDVLTGLDQRPNVMDLNPFEFEALVTNLFRKMGLEAKLTQSSRDGGVDCVAFDPRPVLGGKVVIQAKRYKNTVGVSAVRDLFGTMMNEGANKGILVTTAGYGPDAHAFAKDKPIELIDGSGLLYLLEQQGIRARIVMPE